MTETKSNISSQSPLRQPDEGLGREIAFVRWIESHLSEGVISNTSYYRSSPNP